MTPNDTNENKIQRQSYYLPEFKALVNSEFKDPAAIRQEYMTSNLNRSKTEFVGLEDTGTKTEDDFRNVLLTGVKGLGVNVASTFMEPARLIETGLRKWSDDLKTRPARLKLLQAYARKEISEEEYVSALWEHNRNEYEQARQYSLNEVKLTKQAHENFLKAIGLQMDERDHPLAAMIGGVVGSVGQSMVGSIFLKAPAVVSTVWGLAQTNQSWEEALENGKSRSRAASIAIPNGILNAVIEMVGGEKILKAFKANKPLTKILVSAIGEGGEEFTQGIVDETLMQTLGGREKEFGETVKDLFVSFLVGGIAGGGMAGGHVAFNKLVKMSDAQTAAKIAERVQAAASSVPAQQEAAKLIQRQEHPANFPKDSAKVAIDQTKALMLKQDRKTQLDAISAQKEAMLKENGATDEEARAGSLIAANIINNIALEKGLTPELANSYLNLRIERQGQVEGSLEKADVADNSFDTVLDQGQNPSLEQILEAIPIQADIEAYEKNNGDLVLSKIVVTKENRKHGIGTEALNKLIEYADLSGKRILLTPSTDFGASSVERLKNFYKRFGFIENKGQNKDFSFTEAMSREPQKTYHQNEQESIFKPSAAEKARYSSRLESALNGELKENALIHLGKTPTVYLKLGLKDKTLAISNNVIKKVNKEKHNITSENLKALPDNISNPLMVFKSATQEGSLVSLLDDTDANGERIVAIIKPTDGKINIIPSVYGKEKLINFINKEIVAGRLLYADKNRALARQPGLQLPARGQNSTNNIQTKEQIFKTYNQNSTTNMRGKRGAITLSKKGGVYEALIRIMQSGDRSTILHELGHLWLYTAQDIYSKAEMADIRKDLDAWIGKPKVKDGRYIYSQAQQDKFAEGLETYLREGHPPTPALKAVFDKLHQWFMHIYNGPLVDMSEEGRAIYSRMFQLESQQAEQGLTLYQDAAKNKKMREGIKQLRQTGKMTVEGLTMQDVEKYLQILDMGAPPLPRATLITYLRKYGANYNNTASVNKEQYKNARIPNRQNGIGDDLARRLIDWGFMDGDIENYEDLSSLNSEAAEKIESALAGERVYRLEDLEAVEKFEQYKEAVAMAEDALGGRIEEYRRVVDIIKSLKQEGYREVSAQDIELVVGKLDELAGLLDADEDSAKEITAHKKSIDNTKYLEKQIRENSPADAEQSAALDKLQRQLQDRQDNLEKLQKSYDERLKNNLAQAESIKKSLISEINKREITSKEEMLKELRTAKTAPEIFTAVDNLIEKLQAAYENTPHGRTEQRKLEVPNTDWAAKKLQAIKEINAIVQASDEKTYAAQEWLAEESRAITERRASLSSQEKDSIANAKAFLKENYTPRIIFVLEKVLQEEEHIYPNDKNKIIAQTAKYITRFRKLQNFNLDSFIRLAQKTQAENYNRYIWRKLNALISRKEFEKSGRIKKAKYGEDAMKFLAEAKEIWDLTPENAELKLQTQMQKTFEAFEKGEATGIKDILINRILEFKIKGKDNNPEASRRTFDEVHALMKAGRSNVLNKNIRKQLSRDLMRTAVSQAIRRRKYPMGAKWFLTLSDTHFKEFITNGLGTIEHDIPSPDGNEIVKQKIIFVDVFDTLQGQINTAFYKYEKGANIDDIFRKKMGINGNNSVLNKIAELQKIVFKAENYMRQANEIDGKQQAQLLLNGKWLGEDIKDIDNLNKLEIMSIYEWYKNTLPHENGKDYGLRGRLLRQYGQEQLNEMFALLSNEEIALADALQKFVAAQWTAENAVFSELHGFSLPNDPNYLPSVARRMDIGGDVDFMKEYAANTVNPSFSMQRIKSFRVAMKPTSILTIAQNHTNRAGEYINEAIPFTEIKSVLKNEKVERAFEAAFGRDDGLKVYNKLLRVIDLQAPQKTKAAGDLNKAMEFAYNGWIKAAMALKPTIGIKQFATGISFSEKMPFEIWAKYFIEGLTSPSHTHGFMLKNVPNIGVRYAQGNISESIQRAMASRDINLYATKWNNFTNLLMLNIRLGDAASFIYGGYPYYKYLTQDLKMTPEAAGKKFIEQGEGTLQSSQKALLGEYQANANNYLARLWVVFRNQPKQFFSRLITSYIQYKNGEITPAQFGKVWLIYAFANPMIYQMLGLAWVFGGDDDDNDEKIKKGVFDVLSGPFTGVASVNAFAEAGVGYLLDAAYNKANGKKLPTPQNIKLPAFDDIKRDIAGAVKAYNKAGSMEDLLKEMSVSDVVDGLAALLKYTGFPAQTLVNMAGGVKDIATDKPVRGALRIAGYTHYRAGEITGESKEQDKKRRKKRRNKKDK